MSIYRIATILMLLLLISLNIFIPVSIADRGIVVVVTFPYLVADLKQILAEDDKIYSLVPTGIDPHEYQLRPSDVELLKKANLIVSTGHAPFEVKIRELVSSGEVKAVLLEIPRIKCIKLLKNPATGMPNYHTPIYDPRNYMCFMRTVVEALKSINPAKEDHYDRALKNVMAKIEDLLEYAGKYNYTAVADTPVIQYAVEWLGIRVKMLLIKEHGVPASPGDISLAREYISKGLIDLVIVSEPTVSYASQKLMEIAGEHGIPVLKVPSPLVENMSIVDKLESIVDELNQISAGMKGGKEAGGLDIQSYAWLIAALLVSSIIILFIVLRVIRR